MWIGQRIVAAALLFATGGAAYAQSPFHDIYVGGGLGVSRAGDLVGCSPPAPLTFVTNCTTEDVKAGWRVFLGYQFNRYLAFEAGRADLGKFKKSATVSGLADVSVSDHPTVLGVDVVGTVPIGRFGLLARVGYNRWTLDAVGSTSVVLPGVAENFHDTPKGFSPDFGFGAKWDFTGDLSGRVEYQRFLQIGNADVGKSDVELLSASLLWRFR